MKLSSILTILGVLLIAACGGNNYNHIISSNSSPRGYVIGVPTGKGVQSADQLDTITAKLGLQSLTGKAKCDVSIVQINYQTPGVQSGEMTNASAALLIPSGSNCQGPFPLVAYGRATNLDKAHTVADPAYPETMLLMTFFASQGYAVVATDYLGYALSAYAYHPYTHAETEASAIIDSIRATRMVASSFGLKLNGKVMLTGYSQGGHASMATQRAIEREHSGEFNLVAAAHLAGPYFISAALLDGVKNPIFGEQSIVPFQIASWQKIYGNVYGKASDVFNSPYDGYIETLLPTLNPSGLNSMLPAGTPEEARDAIFKSSFLIDFAGNPKNGAAIAAKKQDLLGWDPQAPTTLCAGFGDPTVKFNINAKAIYDNFKSRGRDNVTLVDVDLKVQQKYGSVLATDAAMYYRLYHGKYESPFCCQVAKELFDLSK